MNAHDIAAIIAGYLQDRDDIALASLDETTGDVDISTQGGKQFMVSVVEYE